MNGVTQTILAGTPGRQGNCLQAAVATILNLPLDDVPHFVELDESWSEALAAFATRHGYATVWTDGYHPAPHLGLAFGPTIRDADIVHAIAVHGQDYWDPHPSRAGLTSVTTYVAWQPLAGLRAGDQ
ncbi:MAG: hypothetical protein WBA97_34970 [Actinophytocola sp.]|uniref:hypothetical protein n=1 Tax=Actinophytocola sp. TaxID=1872138 RepID=UPI003C762CA8